MEHEKRDPGIEELKDVFKKLHTSHENHDLEIVCCGTTFKCHGFLLWSRSTFFAAACKGNFKEAATQRIDLPEDNPDLIAKMMDFLYLFDYDDGHYSGLSNRKDHAYRSARYTNAEMYALGEKYDLQGLKKTAAAKFETALHSETRGTPILPLITLTYASTPENDRGLRDLILPVALVNAKILSSLPGFKSMIVENAEFVSDVFGKTIAPKAPPPYTGTCTRCKAADKWKADHVRCSCGWGESC